MSPSTGLSGRYLWRPVFAGGGRRIIALILLAVLPACSSSPLVTQSVSTLAPLQQADGRSLSAAEVAERVSPPDLLATDAAMRDFVSRYAAGGRGNSRQRLMSLHRAVTGAGVLDLQYDPFADGTAREVFHRGSANCLSYASLFVALAREAGFDATYQWLEVRPQWNRIGERVVVGLHVNVLVTLRNGEKFMVDIDPLPARHVAGTMTISDRDGLALYHSNIAMDALAEKDLEQAWLHAVRALQISPRMSHLWVNLGAIYRFAGQHSEAERSYLYALQLDSSAHSAMANLVILYRLEGRRQEQEYWQQRVAHYQQANPYYHAWLGDQAGNVGHWLEALRDYDRALDLLPGDSRMLYARGLIHYQLEQLDDAAADIRQAIEGASLKSEIENYQLQLDEVRREQVAGV